MKKKIGIVVSQPVPQARKWAEIYTERFSNNSEDNDISFVSIDAISDHLPTLEEIAHFSGFIFMGSPHSANDDLPWIHSLQEFVRTIRNFPRVPKPKMFGICFGHQLIARALGGEVEKNVSGK